ncbi:polyhydroxyalkanoate synthesis regulator phasin [Flavobacterium sp. 28A]|uniref:hypothetical protein n=1 Tax=Flavobacterium sp. 28A TaxID=2735895 RepID=UPI00157011DB|nr:hypothetical protein [Flavobacterium sp. 28A]NRT16355.1 polyhydroxyalkanoate synthesis regulator phasin [Flavobacterium sp. 28A]
MKTNFLSLTMITLMAGTILTSCGKTTKDDASAVKEDVTELNRDLEQGAKDTGVETKEAVNADWKKFEASSKIAIENTDTQIKALRDKIAKADKAEKVKLTAKLDELEKKNTELKEKLEKRGVAFKEDVKEMNQSAKEEEQEFEREFTHDMDELGTALKDLFKDNVK